MPQKFDKTNKICYKCQSYKSVTINYKGVIIISIRVKAISVILAVLFVFAGATYAFAEEPNVYSLSSSGSSASISNVRIKKTAAIELMPSSNFEITAKDVTDSSVVLSWESDNKYIAYKVCIFNVFANKWDEYTQTSGNSVKISNLTAETNYRFCVLNYLTNEVLGAVQIKTAIKTPELKVKEKTSKKIVLSLGKHSANETVVIYRKTGSANYKKLAEVKGKSTYTDKNLKGNKTYCYKAKTVAKKDGETYESAFSKVIKPKTLLSMGLPSVSGKTKTYAYYTAVTAKSSPQYKLLRSEKCTTDKETGIRMYDGCYCVALGSYYGTKIGTKYRITFSSGNSINVILCDQKANRHTDSKHQYAVNNKDIVEFYVQRNKIPRGIRGDYGRLSKFSGSVVSIEKYVD